MKSYISIFVATLPCFVISFLLFYPYIGNKNRFLKIGKQLVVIKNADNELYEWHKMIIKYLQFPLDNHYGSHAIVLLAVLYATKTGPILELGMGSTSTPLLHRISFEQKRSLVSADCDRQWIDRFSSFTKNNSLHRIKYIEVKSELGIEWSQENLHDMNYWSIVFIDHRPGTRRQYDLKLYPYRTDFVILHDTEQSSLYKYNEGLTYYPYQYRFTKLKTFTDVLSAKKERLIQKIRFLLETIPDSYFTNITLK